MITYNTVHYDVHFMCSILRGILCIWMQYKSHITCMVYVLWHIELTYDRIFWPCPSSASLPQRAHPSSRLLHPILYTDEERYVTHTAVP